MVNKYTIKYLPLFYNDLDKITNYILYKLKNKIAADNLVNELEKAITQRASNPDCYEKYISSKKRNKTYFKIYIKNYTVFYTVNNKTMEVRRILSNRRNFDKLI